MKVLIDTNIIIDALTTRTPWNQNAEKLFFMAANHTAQMYITSNTATDIYYLLRKYLQSTEESKQTMSKLFSLFGILDVTGNDCINALSSSIPDYEDAVLEQSALRSDIDYIVTRNIKDYTFSSISALLPEDFIALMEES